MSHYKWSLNTSNRLPLRHIRQLTAYCAEFKHSQTPTGRSISDEYKSLPLTSAMTSDDTWRLLLWLQTDREQKNIQHIKSTKKSNEIYMMDQIINTAWCLRYSYIYRTCPAINLGSILPLMVDFFPPFFWRLLAVETIVAMLNKNQMLCNIT